ncbi:MAG: glycerate kinase [Acidimicrobiales bacterium]
MPVLLAAPDKFRGTATARQIAGAVYRAATPLGWSVIESPLSDGGEGLIDVSRGPDDRVEVVEVTGPLGQPVSASLLLGQDRAVIEMAQASGLALVGGRDGNRPMEATTWGTGQLLVAAAQALADRHRSISGRLPSRTVLPPTAGTTPSSCAPPIAVERYPTITIGLGGSATTDGGLGALTAIEETGGLGGVELIAACDVNVGFLDAARLFAAQKGATRQQVIELTGRLDRLADLYQQRYGVDIRAIPGSGAAGGLGGALAALGGRLHAGYRLVADMVGLQRSLEQAHLVVTGEGALDVTSFAGKVVGGVLGDASALGIPSLVIAGRASAEAGEQVRGYGAHIVSLSDRFGEDRATHHTLACVEAVVDQALDSFGFTER